MQEHEKWMDSLEAKTNALQAAFQNLSQDTLNSNFLKGGITALTELVNIIDRLVKTFGALPTTAVIGSIGALFFNFGSSNEFAHYGCESIAA